MSTPTRTPGRSSDRQPDHTGDLLRRRAEAIEVSGWGEPFHFRQPRNACFWVYLAVVVPGVLLGLMVLSSKVGYYSPAFSAGIVIAVINTLAWGWWFHHLDRFERQPLSVVVACFLWGGFGAVFMVAGWGNPSLASIYTKVFGAVWSADWHAGLSAPFVEESAKAAGFILVFGLARTLVRTAADGLFLGAFIGLGFQTIEDLSYTTSIAARGFGADQLGNVTGGIWTRTVSDFVSHPMFSALVCAGLVYLAGTPAQPRRVGRGLAFVATGVGLHLILDSLRVLSADTGIPANVLFFGEIAVAAGIIWYAFRVTDERERELARDILAPEAAAGVLDDEELRAVTGRNDRRTYLKAAASRHERRRREHVLAAALDLCHDLARSRGTETAAVTASRTEVARLRGTASAASR